MSREELRNKAQAVVLRANASATERIDHLTDVFEEVIRDAVKGSLQDLLETLQKMINDTDDKFAERKLMDVKDIILDRLGHSRTPNLDDLETLALSARKNWDPGRWHNEKTLVSFDPEDRDFITKTTPDVVLGLIAWIRRVDPAFQKNPPPQPTPGKRSPVIK